MFSAHTINRFRSERLRLEAFLFDWYFLLERLLPQRLHLPSVLLPLLVLSVTFTSKPADVLLHQAISSTFMLVAIIIFYRACVNKLFAMGIITALVLLRVLRFVYGSESGQLEVIYFVPYVVVLLGVGAKMIRDYPLLLLRQITWICAISALLSLMQIMGVQWAQSLTNYYWIEGGADDPFLFVPWSDIALQTGLQARPVGFASANNIVSQYLLFFFAFAMFWRVSKRNYFRPPAMWLFIISFACALTGSKLVVVGIVLITIVAFLIAEKTAYLQVFRTFLLTSAAYGLYWFLFPGLFIYNLNLDLLSFNMMVRIVNILTTTEVPFVGNVLQFLSQYNTGAHIGDRDVLSTVGMLEGAQISGIGSIMNYYWIVLFAFAFLIPVWLVLLRRLCEGPYIAMKKLSIVMFIAALTSTAGGPFIFTSYFWFFFSFALYPLSVLLLKNQQGKHVDPVVLGSSYARPTL